jgi:PAS domain S-box-containing protein
MITGLNEARSDALPAAGIRSASPPRDARLPGALGGSLLRSLLGEFEDATLLISRTGAVVEANDAFCRLAGFDHAELLGRMAPLRDGVPEARERDDRDVGSVAAWMAAIVIVCADGSHRAVVASVSQFAGHDDLVDGYLLRVPLETVPLERLLRERRAPIFGEASRVRRAFATAPPFRRRFTSELELASERGEFFARYQPIVSLRDGEIEGFEALLRWNHPTHGVVGPGAFLGEAESRGVLADITCHILHAACCDAAHWNMLRRSDRPIGVSVNLCGSQLRDDGLIASIDEALMASNLPAAQLWLEITENTGITEATRDPGLLREIRSVGVKIVLDDFGAGYASLGSVRRLPLDALKFDRSLVEGVADNRCDARILAAGIEIAQALEIDAIAEGIEHERQLDYLRSLDCSYGQGYFYSRPLDRGRADLLIADTPSWPVLVDALLPTSSGGS